MNTIRASHKFTEIENRKNTQYERVLAYLKTGRELSPLYALSHFGQISLAVAVFKLRQQGHAIATRFQKDLNGKTTAVYRLKTEQ
jgi:hypothetical protein